MERQASHGFLRTVGSRLFRYPFREIDSALSSYLRRPTIDRLLDIIYRSARHGRDHEARVSLLARIIEVRGGEDDDYAKRFLDAIIKHAKERDKTIAIKLAARRSG